MKQLFKRFSAHPFAPFFYLFSAGFLFAYIIVALFVFPAGAAQHDGTVPNVVGVPFADAQRQLMQAGYNVTRGESRPHNAAPRGTVLEQVPEPGANAAAGSRVTLAVSAGPRLGVVPAVIGMSREQALTSLEGAGFVAGVVSERPSNEPRGAVIDSRPRPGAQAPMPSPIALVVSAGPTTIEIPDLIGRPLSEATLLLRQVGLTVGDVRGPNEGIPDPSSIVQSQSPSAGNQVSAGTRVNIIVGRS